MKAEMGFEITFFKKPLVAIRNGAEVFTLAEVFFIMDLKALSSCVRLATTFKSAFKGFMLLVGFLMVL